MKLFSAFSLLILITACDPYGFGYKKNPAYTLKEAFDAIHKQDVVSFLEVSGKEALCLYGNSTGINYLKEKLLLDPDNVDIEPKMLTEKRMKAPQWVGYWSYHNERYLVNINSKESGKNILQVIVDCDFGSDRKDQKFQDPAFKKFKKKECKLVKVVPKEFASLPVPEKCNQLKVLLPQDAVMETFKLMIPSFL